MAATSDEYRALAFNGTASTFLASAWGLWLVLSQTRVKDLPKSCAITVTQNLFLL
jgi:hypothetical protein